ncbi:MAG: hypothetical protein J6Y36_07010 [Treponema sp.]|uniref:hypothetical protein n=1 Tax=Treponema sp. TaxID=166 RepID=UPI001B67633A|nr:hypothetical protein [Treponema sp.]MBP5402889.1 hypothetical protein [Treponema sp.]MBR5932943.1 hypothetical protein [Treponema sp.]
MILFLLKKNFFDSWENIINLLIPNLVIDVFFALGVFGYVKCGFPFSYLALGLVFTGVTLTVVFAGCFGKNALSVANFGTATVGNYFSNIGQSFKDFFMFGMLAALVVLSAFTGLPLYMGINGFIGFVFFTMLSIFIFIMALGLQWFVALKIILGGDFKKTLRKCFEILFDNFGFSVFMLFYVWWPFIVCFVLLNVTGNLFSFPGVLGACVAVTVFLPGFSGGVLSYVNALRLRLYKYDWLEQHKDLKKAGTRKNIPWEALIKEDRDTLGKKSIRSLITPWKSEKEDV